MVDTLQPGFMQIRLEALSSAECLLEHDDTEPRAIVFERQLRLGGSGTVLQTHDLVEGFKVGDAVVACLSDWDISTDSRGEEMATVHESLVCKLPATASKSDSAPIPVAFVIATAILHNASGISLPFRSVEQQQQQEDLSPRNLLLISNNTVLPLMVIKLLRLYTVSTIFIVYKPKTSTESTEGAVSIDPAMMAGANFAQEPSSTSDLWEVARGLRSNLGHYGPYSGSDCFDLLLDLTGQAETPEPYRRLLCPNIGRLVQLTQAVHTDLEWLFTEMRIMEELGRRLERGEMGAQLVNIRHS
ncbi:hypothetical protein PRZ48_012561 [Zasmidium cellare]|uniref:Uncharacterized protein n=1 Tax=Zasmidium cellare TaxID=395010 RepID=A0ABR0E5S2_ZASCE|nr:hypothetical protein PRZ48_012561 [Zasmidium cellare]